MSNLPPIYLDLHTNHQGEGCFFLKIGDDAYSGKVSNLPALAAAINVAVLSAARGATVTAGRSYTPGLRSEALKECRL